MPQEPPPRRPAAPVPGTHRHEQLGRVAEAAQEDHDVHALGQARDLAEPDHELVLLRELLWWLLVPLELPDQGPLVLGGQEAQQQLQEVEAQDLLVVPAGGDTPGTVRPSAGPEAPLSLPAGSIILPPPQLVPASLHLSISGPCISLSPHMDPSISLSLVPTSLHFISGSCIPPSLCIWSCTPPAPQLLSMSLCLSVSHITFLHLSIPTSDHSLPPSLCILSLHPHADPCIPSNPPPCQPLGPHGLCPTLS